MTKIYRVHNIMTGGWLDATSLENALEIRQQLSEQYTRQNLHLFHLTEVVITENSELHTSLDHSGFRREQPAEVTTAEDLAQVSSSQDLSIEQDLERQLIQIEDQYQTDRARLEQIMAQHLRQKNTPVTVVSSTTTHVHLLAGGGIANFN